MSEFNEPLDGQHILPDPYEEQAPEQDINAELGILHPERYEECPGCEAKAFDPDIECCRECNYDTHDSDTVPSEEEIERGRESLARAMERIEARRGRCDALNPACECYAVVECHYPIYDEYSGKYLGDMAAKWCVPHYREFHDASGTNVLYGVRPRKVEYV